MILLYADGISGQIGMQPATIEGRSAPARVYDIRDHWVEVDGTGIDEVAQHDAAEIASMNGFRLALPIEQAEYQKAKRKSGKLTEKTVSIAPVDTVAAVREDQDNGGQ